ncbi:MAG: histidinol-phosphate transaminase [Comamonadaceae bacterium]|nr:histidinol-phosphate transaminase [Comamonadaceae bacterium]
MAEEEATRLQFNPHVWALPPYNAGMSVSDARALSGRDDVARLASNENPEGCSPKVAEVLREMAWEPWRYADPACRALRAALARHLRVDADHIVVGNGSEELIAAVSRAVLQPGAQVVTVAPSFGLHEIEPLACGASVVKVPMSDRLTFDVPALQAALAAKPALCFLSTPWNPVGPALSEAQLARLVASASPETLLVMDEAYFEYADEQGPDVLQALRASGLPYVALRTFSKAYGLAGLRVGYAICSHRQIARAMANAKTPFNVNAAAQAAAQAALADQAWMRASVQRLRAERERVRAQLGQQGWRVAPSQTNFLFVDTRQNSVDVAERLLRAHGIIVKAWREPGYEQFLRVTIGMPPENNRFLDAMRALATPSAMPELPAATGEAA